MSSLYNGNALKNAHQAGLGGAKSFMVNQLNVPNDIAQLTADARSHYPFLKHDNFVASYAAPIDVPNRGYMETFPPGEEGSARYPRPNVPLDTAAIEIYKHSSTPKDLAADVYSHADKYGVAASQGLGRSFNDSQISELRKQFLDYDDTINENAPRAKERAATNVASSLLRSGALNQSNVNMNDFHLNPAQQEVIADAKQYVTTGNFPEGPKRDPSYEAALHPKFDDHSWHK